MHAICAVCVHSMCVWGCCMLLSVCAMCCVYVVYLVCLCGLRIVPCYVCGVYVLYVQFVYNMNVSCVLWVWCVCRLNVVCVICVFVVYMFGACVYVWCVCSMWVFCVCSILCVCLFHMPYVCCIFLCDFREYFEVAPSQMPPCLPVSLPLTGSPFAPACHAVFHMYSAPHSGAPSSLLS